MLRRIAIYGLFGGLIVSASNVWGAYAMAMEKPWENGLLLGYAFILAALTFVFIGIKRQRDVGQGGVIKFFPALGLGLAISVVASVFYVAAWEAGQALFHLDFASVYSNMMVEKAKAAGKSAAELEAIVAEMDAFKVQYADPLFRLPMTFIEIFPVGVLVSLISAALLRNPRFMAAKRAG